MVQLIIPLTALLLIAALVMMARTRTVADEPAGEPAEGASGDIRRMSLHSRTKGYGVLLPRRGVIRLMRRLIRHNSHLPAAVMLGDHCRELACLCVDVQSSLRKPLLLPKDQHGRIRMLRLCMALLEEDDCVTAQRLMAGLQAWQEGSGTALSERVHLPLCMKLTLTGLLEDALHELRHDLADQHAGQQMAQRLLRARQPEKLLQQLRHTPAYMHSLLAILAEKPQGDLLGRVECLLEEAGAAPQAMAEQFVRRQDVLAKRISSILATWRALKIADWNGLSEPEDPLHKALSMDPDSTYPRMDAPSRRLYREAVARLARLFAVEEARVVHSCVQLAGETPADTPGSHVGWYLLTWEGQRMLMRRLKTRRGIGRLLAEHHRSAIYRVCLGAAAFVGGISYLNRGHPLWTLPFFLGVISGVTHLLADGLVSQLSHAPLPRLQIDTVEEQARTLIVLPAVVEDAAHGARLIQHLRDARASCPEGAIDCLLLADLLENATATSAADSMTISGIDDSHGVYLMVRQRAWSADKRMFTGRGGLYGAMDALNRLICSGECDDQFLHATIEPHRLYRRYAYVFTLDENSLLTPGSLLAMIGVLAHPLNQRFSIVRPRVTCNPAGIATVCSWLHRRNAPGPWVHLDGHGRYEGVGMFRPDALLEQTQGMHVDGLHPLIGELAGCAEIPEEQLFVPPAASVAREIAQLRSRAGDTSGILPWLLPWVHTPEGLIRNPLLSVSLARLRDQLRQTLLPLCRMALLLYAALIRNEGLALLALVPDSPHLLRHLSQLCLLPWRSFNEIGFLLQHVRRTLRPVSPGKTSFVLPDHMAMSDATEIITQSVSAAILLGVSLVPWPGCFTGVVLGISWCCFLPIIRLLDNPLPEPAMPEDSIEFLMEAVRAAWSYFDEHVTPQTHHLPPESFQEYPRLGAANFTTPAAAAMYILSCAAAVSLGLLSPDDAAARLHATAASLSALSRWHGLFYARYDLAAMAPSGSISTEDNGLLCASLLCAAQAFADMPNISEQLIILAREMDFRQLYDNQTQLFFREMRTPGHQPEGHITLLASEGTLTSLLAMTMGFVPRHHLARLDRTTARTCRGRALISPHGGISDYLTLSLFLPPARNTALRENIRTMIRTQRAHGIDGLFGASDSAWWAFDEEMRYRRGSFGEPSLSLRSREKTWVAAPYALALCAAFDPEAITVLRSLRALSMFGKHGFYESIDLRPGEERKPVRMWTARHQGMLICALCRTLTGDALSRHFLSIPGMRSWQLLLHEELTASPSLPAGLVCRADPETEETSFSLTADPSAVPGAAHVLSGGGVVLVINARGSHGLWAGMQPLTRFDGDPGLREGVCFMLSDGRDAFDPMENARVTFAEGNAQFRRTVHGMDTLLTVLIDPLSGACIHRLNIVNQTDRERRIEVSDSFTPHRTHHITRPRPHELHILGPAGNWAHVVACDGGMAGITADLSTERVTLCVALRMGEQGRVALQYATYPADSSAVRPSVRADQGLSMARLHSRVLTSAIGLPQSACPEALHLWGAILWRSLPHQGPQEAIHPAAAAHLPPDPYVLIHLGGQRGTELLQEVISTLSWLRMMHVPVHLSVIAPGRRSLQWAREVISASPMRNDVSFDTADGLSMDRLAAMESAARLVLRDDTDLATQLHALTIHLPAPSLKRLCPLPILQEDLLFESSTGGYHPATGDYVCTGDGFPGRYALTGCPLVTELGSDGLYATRHEDELITANRPLPSETLLIRVGHACISAAPPDARIQLSPGAVAWHSVYETLEVSFTAGMLADHPAGLRTLRIRNTGYRPVTLQTAYCAQFATDSSLTHLTAVRNGVVASRPGTSGTDWLSALEDTPDLLVVSPVMLQGDTPFAAAPIISPGGTAVVLRREITLKAQETVSLTWLLGHTNTLDEIEEALTYVRRFGASAALRLTRQRWAEQLSQLNVTTPDPAVDLLLNRVLPMQAYGGNAPLTLAYLEEIPSALQPVPDLDESMLSLTAAWHGRITGKPLPADLYDQCLHALTGVTLDAGGLLSFDGEASLWRSLRYIAALRLFSDYAPEDHRSDMLDMAQHVLTAAKAHLPADDIRTAAWAVLAGWEHGPDALAQAWPTFDPRHAALWDAVWIIWALAAAGLYEEAWMLLHAVNPVYAPFDHRDDHAADWLYAVVLDQLLGFRKEGARIRFAPKAPAIWTQFTLTLRHGASTWRFELSRDARGSVCDGEPLPEPWITLIDDGRIHHVRLKMDGM